ncbi:MAG TPA: glycosyltransferase [Pirellulales bacterium]|nr:glycosyltransferase [Pirellulales bacterium]
MIHYSVLIPERDAAERVGRLLPQLEAALGGLLLPYEIICIDDASDSESIQELAALLPCHPRLRVLHFDVSRGTSAALTAGLAAARGDLVIAVDPRVDDAARYLPHLVARLSQHDLVIARHEHSPWRELWQRAARLPRLVAAGPHLRQSEELFWAARRQAVSGLALARGAFRVLGQIVARRGYRVCQLLLSDTLPPQGARYRADLAGRLAGLWLERSFEPHLASEMLRCEGSDRHMVPSRFDAARPRYIPQPVFTPLAQESDDTA